MSGRLFPLEIAQLIFSAIGISISDMANVNVVFLLVHRFSMIALYGWILGEAWPASIGIAWLLISMRCLASLLR